MNDAAGLKPLRLLIVGDPHVTVEELGDCQGLMALIDQTLEADPTIDHVVFLGDLHHNHRLIDVDVMVPEGFTIPKALKHFVIRDEVRIREAL